MKFQYILAIVFSLGIAAIIGMLFEGTRHEQVIVGTWKEVAWIYEGELNPTDFDVRKHALESLNESLGHEFFVHENETWSFSEKGELLTHSNYSSDATSDKNLNWVIKGRGNILVLKDGDERLESYNITQLNDDTLILYFALDLQAKGVAELIFERVRE